MNVEKQEQVTYLVTLTAEEARYLRSLTQNPYMYKTNTDEPTNETNIRATIFEAFHNIGVK